jgi:hypothetical protein
MIDPHPVLLAGLILGLICYLPPTFVAAWNLYANNF